MSSDAYPDNTLQPRLLQHDSIHATSYDRIEMNIGQWYVDEFGNRTREITARDANEEIRVRAQSEPHDRTKQIRTAAERLAQLTAF